MKKTRRQELKTNQLSIYLQQMAEMLQKNANYILGGVVAVAVILVAGWMIQRHRHGVEQAAWGRYFSIKDRAAVPTTQLADEIGELAGEVSGHRGLGPRTLELKGDIAYGRAITMPAPADPGQRKELLHQAMAAYQTVLDQFGQEAETAARARMSLAAARESLLVLGEGSVDDIRRLYQEVTSSKTTGFAADAQKQLDSLDKRLAELKIVASRPAEPPEVLTPLVTPPAITVTPVPSPPEVSPPPTEASPEPAESPAPEPAAVPEPAPAPEQSSAEPPVSEPAGEN